PGSTLFPTRRSSDLSGPLVEVWKSPTCGCCKDWIAHMEANGFRIDVNDSGNTAARARLGIAQKFGSCHTALVDGYAIEGHVPARSEEHTSELQSREN